MVKDARTLVAYALSSAREEPYEENWTQARIEAAMRRVIRELETHVALTVQQESETVGAGAAHD